MLPKREELESRAELLRSAAGASGVPDVTVVTVVFNAVAGGRRDDLLRCLESVQSQTGVAVEHLVIDGGSADGTPDLVRSFRPASHPIRLFSAKDAGIYEAMNRGIALADGKYVVFLNSDDRYHAACGLADSFAALERTGASFSYAPARVVDETGKDVEHPFCEASPYSFYEGMTICHQTVLTRRDALVALDGFDRRYRSASDYDLLFRLTFLGHRACRVDTCFVTFRTGGFSFAHADLCDREVGDVYADLFNRYVGANLTADEGLALRKAQAFPAWLALRLQPFGRKAFGDEFRPGERMLSWWGPSSDYEVEKAADESFYSTVRPYGKKNLLRLVARYPRRMLGVFCSAVRNRFRCGGRPYGELLAETVEWQKRHERVLVLPSAVLKEHGECRAMKSGLAIPGALTLQVEIPVHLRRRAVGETVLKRAGGAVRGDFRTLPSRLVREGRVEISVECRDDVTFVGAYLCALG